MVYLAIKYASEKWTVPIQNWRQTMDCFIIEFEERLEMHINEMAETESVIGSAHLTIHISAPLQTTTSVSLKA